MKLRCNNYFYLPTDSFWSLAPDCLYVFCAEFLVDWVKHAFITRFNPELSTDLYKVYTTNLAYDLAITKQTNVSSIYDSYDFNHEKILANCIKMMLTIKFGIFFRQTQIIPISFRVEWDSFHCP